MSINAVKGVEIGDGFATAALTGEENADEMRMGNDGKPVFLANHAGGILGGISTGQPIVARFAVKPTSSILSPRKTIEKSGAETEILTKGRHDPCVGIRAVPVGEAMMACVLADQALRHRGQSRLVRRPGPRALLLAGIGPQDIHRRLARLGQRKGDQHLVIERHSPAVRDDAHCPARPRRSPHTGGHPCRYRSSARRRKRPASWPPTACGPVRSSWA